MMNRAFALALSLVAAVAFAGGCRSTGKGPTTIPTGASAQSVVAGQPAHLVWAQRLVQEIRPENNQQGYSPTYVEWQGVDGAAVTRNRSVSSSLITNLLKRAYGFAPADFTGWLGTAEPRAIVYYEAVAKGNGFGVIERVEDIRPGDLLAVRFPPGNDSSGDVMIVAEAPKARTASSPVAEGTRQYELVVIDCNKTGHGSGDTRRNPDGTWHAGVGMGTIRLHADAQGRISGYANSTEGDASYWTAEQRPVAVGRLRPDRIGQH